MRLFYVHFVKFQHNMTFKAWWVYKSTRFLENGHPQVHWEQQRRRLNKIHLLHVDINVHTHAREWKIQALHPTQISHQQKPRLSPMSTSIMPQPANVDSISNRDLTRTKLILQDHRSPEWWQGVQKCHWADLQQTWLGPQGQLKHRFRQSGGGREIELGLSRCYIHMLHLVTVV